VKFFSSYLSKTLVTSNLLFCYLYQLLKITLVCDLSDFVLTLQLLLALRSMFLLHWSRRLCSNVLLFMIVGYIWRKPAHLCHQRRHLLNDVGGNGESGESGEKSEMLLWLSSCMLTWLVKVLSVGISHIGESCVILIKPNAKVNSKYCSVSTCLKTVCYRRRCYTWTVQKMARHCTLLRTP